MRTDPKLRFRLVGTLVFLIGVASACVLYWIRTRAANVMDDAAMAGYSKPELMQMGALYGKMGLMTSDLLDDLKQPGTQAILIGLFSALVAFACFFLANRWVDEEEDKGEER
jgi:hypothetical protein